MKTKEEILSEVTGIPIYRLGDDRGEFITKSAALNAMNMYASQFRKPKSEKSVTYKRKLKIDQVLEDQENRLKLKLRQMHSKQKLMVKLKLVLLLL